MHITTGYGNYGNPATGAGHHLPHLQSFHRRRWSLRCHRHWATGRRRFTGAGLGPRLGQVLAEGVDVPGVSVEVANMTGKSLINGGL